MYTYTLTHLHTYTLARLHACRFVTPDATFNYCGGVEYGFLSATTNRNVALHYGKGGYLISLTTSLASRGASLKPFSYYPGEDVRQ